MALTLFGIFGLSSFAFNEANNVAKSLNIRLESKVAGYRLEEGERLIGYNQEATGRRGRQQATKTWVTTPRRCAKAPSSAWPCLTSVLPSALKSRKVCGT